MDKYTYTLNQIQNKKENFIIGSRQIGLSNQAIKSLLASDKRDKTLVVAAQSYKDTKRKLSMFDKSNKIKLLDVHQFLSKMEDDYYIDCAVYFDNVFFDKNSYKIDFDKLVGLNNNVIFINSGINDNLLLAMESLNGKIGVETIVFEVPSMLEVIGEKNYQLEYMNNIATSALPNSVVEKLQKIIDSNKTNITHLESETIYN